MQSKRVRGAGSGPLTAKQKGQIASYRFNKLHPWSDWGAARLLRGSPHNIDQFGETWKTANAQQRENRRISGFTGRGLYQGTMSSGRGVYMRPQFKGRGGFFDDLEAVGNRFITKGIPNLLNAASGIRSFMGRGEYTSNNLVDGPHESLGQPPNIRTLPNETGACVIEHQEYLGDVYGPGVAGGAAVAFQNTAYSLNPGLQTTFTFLSQIAANYEEYEFHKIIFKYRSTTTDIGNSTNGQCGTVIMCTNYNAASAKFTDKQSMLEYGHATDCKVTENLVHGVECDPAKSAMSPSLFVRSNPVVSGQDLKTYDKGLFQIAIANCPAAYNGFSLGELWVEYKVVLRKPRLFVARGMEIDCDLYFDSTKLDSTCSPAIAATTSPWGDTSKLNYLVGQQNNIGCQFVSAANTCVIVTGKQKA